MNKMVSALVNANNVTLNEKGSLAFKSTLNPVLDYFSRGGAMRASSALDVDRLFSAAFFADKLLALKTMFYLRDIRGGQGERKVFRTALFALARMDSALCEKVLPLVPEYGRWDDLFVLFGSKLEDQVLKMVRAQLQEDINNYRANQNVSLLAKWLPSENASSQKTKALARKIRSYLGYDSKTYRLTLSQLRRHLDVVEIKMCENKWSAINYSKVPSRASLIYRKSFSKHDKDRYSQFIVDVTSGKEKINAGTLYPYDIVEKCFSQSDATLDALWKSLPNYIQEPSNSLVVADVSGSMFGMPMNVAISLALYISERNTGPWKDKFLTFSTNPSLVQVVGKTISEKVRNLSQAEWGGTTNLNATFDLILKAAKANSVPEEDMPKVLFIVSDMQFDAACGRATNFQTMKQQYAAAGYKLPKVVFWNVRAANNSPAKHDDENVMLVSGASPSIFESAVNCKLITPVDAMLDVLNKPRYNLVEDCLK